MRLGRGCHALLQGGITGMGNYLSCTSIKVEEEKKMGNGKWRKVLLAVGIAFAVLMAALTLWIRMHRNITGPGGEADHEGVWPVRVGGAVVRGVGGRIYQHGVKGARMETKKMIVLGILAAAVCLGLLFQPQTALAASRGTGEENGTGIPDALGGQGKDTFGARDVLGYADGDNVAVVDSASTAYSEETPSIISVTAVVPEHFGLAAYAEIISVESGAVYGLLLYAENGYYQWCYVPVEAYYVGNVAVYGDTTNEYPFDFPTGDFMVDEKDPFEITASLADFESVDAEIRERRWEDVEDTAPVETDFVVAYSGTRNG